MTLQQAHQLLDAARDGADVPMLDITRALVETGDAEAVFESFSIDMRSPESEHLFPWRRSHA